jgi:predicted dehydrogenase
MTSNPVNLCSQHDAPCQHIERPPSINVALVGCGFMGSMHAQIYARIPKAHLVAAVDHRVDVARARLERIGFSIPIYETLEELLGRHPEIAVVDICTPADEHERHASLAIDAGKHCFCEKPLAPTLEAADRILVKARSSKRFFQVGHCIRFWPEYNVLRRFARERMSGRLLSISLQRQASRPSYSDDDWLNQPMRSGGAALDLHIHDTDFVIALLGLPRAVKSRATFDRSGPSHIFTIYDFDDVAVCAEGGWNYPSHWGFRMAFQALFEGACIDFDSTKTPTLSITRQDRAPESMPFSVPIAGVSAAGEGNISSLGGYFNELQYFIGRIADGLAPSEATLDDARTSLWVVLAEIESARSGQTIPIPAHP